MKNKQKGIIIFSKKVKDNDLYIRILSTNDQIDSGMVYGGNSYKKKMIFQNGYFIDYIFTKKNDYSPPVFTADISGPFLGIIFNDKYKLNALLSIISLINLSIFEGQKIKGIYNSIYNLIIKIIYQNHWIVFYCSWLFELLKLIGYQVDYMNNKKQKFFNISKQEFSNLNSHNSIEFPHDLFSKNQEISFNNLNLIFSIFENIFSKNHLENINYTMPKNFINFKKIILHKL